MMTDVTAKSVHESSSKMHEYIVSVKCPICGKEVVSLHFGAKDDKDDALKEEHCEHTVYLNNYHLNVYWDESKQEYLKEYIAYNMQEEGEDEEEIEEFRNSELICSEDEFEYDWYISERDAKSIAAFMSERHPEKEFLYADSQRDFGGPACGCSIAYAAIFMAN